MMPQHQEPEEHQKDFEDHDAAIFWIQAPLRKKQKGAAFRTQAQVIAN
jgi:hypothetical protein